MSGEGDGATRWVAVWALFLSGCTLALHAGKVPSALLPLREELDLSLTAAGAIVATYAVLIALGGIAAGLLVGVVGHVRFAVGGTALAGLGSLLGATADALPRLLTGRVLEGAGWIIAVVALPSLLARLANTADRPLVMGLWGAFVPVGAGSMLLVAPAIQGLAGWRLSWLVAGSVSLAASVIVARVCRRERDRLVPLAPPASSVRESLRPVVRSPFADALADLGRPDAWLVGACFLLYSFQFTAVTSFLPTLLVETARFALGPAAALTAFVILGNALGNVAAGYLPRRGVGHVPVLAFAALASGAAAAVAYQAGWPVPLRIAAVFGFSVIAGLVPGTLFATMPRVASSPATLGVLIGLMLQCAGVGQWLGPLALPAVVERLGSWSAAALPISLAAVLGAVAAFGLRRLPAR